MSKAKSTIAMRAKMRAMKEQKLKEEGKEISPEREIEDEMREFIYPDECKTLDIMKEKYYQAIQFFHDTENKE